MAVHRDYGACVEMCVVGDTEMPEGRIGIGAEDSAGAYPADLERALGEGLPGAGSK